MATGAEIARPQGAPKSVQLTGAERFWYVVQCIAFGAGYLAKVPTKKALSEIGAVQMTSAERTWYVIQNILFGSGYFAKIPARKALSDIGVTRLTGAQQFWYVLQNIAFGHGYFLEDVPFAVELRDGDPGLMFKQARA